MEKSPSEGVLYDPTLFADEEFLPPPGMRIVTRDKEVYRIMGPEFIDSGSLEQVLGQTSSFDSVGIVCAEGALGTWDPSVLATTTRLVFMNAFDGEGYVVWQQEGH